jgi:hypothetical protein
MIQYRTQTSTVDCAAQAIEMAKVWDEVVKSHGVGARVNQVVLFYEDPSGRSVAMEFTKTASGEYVRLRRDVEQNPTTFVLIPSLNYGLCVAETERRQLTRPFAGSPTKEEGVIRERFRIYVDLPIRKIETMHPLQLIVDEIVTSMGCHEFRA